MPSLATIPLCCIVDHKHLKALVCHFRHMLSLAKNLRVSSLNIPDSFLYVMGGESGRREESLGKALLYVTSEIGGAHHNR